MIKKIYYISPRDMRKNRADAVHIMLTCDGFTKQGIIVELITPYVKRAEYKVAKSKIFDLYGLNESFSINELPTMINEYSSYSTNFFYIVINKFFFFFSFFS